MKPIWVIIITFLISAGLIGGGVWYYQSVKAKNNTNDLNSQIALLNSQKIDLQKQVTASKTTSTASSTTTASTADWKTYTDPTLKISFKYPKNWFIFKSTRDGRIYIQNAEQTKDDQYNVSNTPTNFERTWITYNQSEFTYKDQSALSALTLSQIQRTGFVVKVYTNTSTTNPTAWAYWSNNTEQFEATIATELPTASNQAQEITTLKQILSTVGSTQ